MAYYARRGIMCLGYDILPETVHNVNAGKVPFAGLGQWLGFSTEPLVKNGLMHGTNRVADIIDDESVKVHFVSIPTEKNGKPWDGALLDVSKKLAARKVSTHRNLIIVESTLAPGQCEGILVETLQRSGRKIPEEFLVAVGPRRE